MAQKTCISTLVDDIMNDCNDDYGRGIEGTIYALSRRYLDTSKHRENPHIVPKLEWTGGSENRGHKFGYVSSETPAITVTDLNPVIGTGFDKVLPLMLLADSPKNAAAIQALKTDKYVFIYENTVKGEDGSQAFPIIGWETGAMAKDANMDKSDDTAKGGWTCNITETEAPTSQIFFWMGDYQTTKEALEALCAPAEDDETL